jgi:hypothetical protein
MDQSYTIGRFRVNPGANADLMHPQVAFTNRTRQPLATLPNCLDSASEGFHRDFR